MQRAIRTCLLRGGSSKGVYLHSRDLPPPGALRDAVVLRLFGSPDARQVDGLGGADVLTSKMAIVGPATVPNADVDYTFGQVSFVAAQVDYKGNCGNISAGVGPFAIDEGLVAPVEPGATTRLVRIHNTNTQAILRAEVPVGPDGGVLVEGACEIGGVPGAGARIDLDFSATQGSVTGHLLPTGLRQEALRVPTSIGEGAAEEEFEATLLDAGQPTVFVRSEALGLPRRSAAGAVEALRQSEGLMRRIERLRGAAAVRMGIVQRWEDAEAHSPYTPFVVAVSSPEEAQPWDLTATCVFMQMPHQAYPVTGSVATTAAALLPGTVVHACARAPSRGAPLRIGHPTGVMEVFGEVADDGAAPSLTRASIARTARRLMDGQAYVPWSVWPSDP